MAFSARSALFNRAAGLASLLLTACVDVGGPPEEGVRASTDAGLLDGGVSTPDAAIVAAPRLPIGTADATVTTIAEFRGTVDASTGRMRIETLEGASVTDPGLRRAQQGLCSLSIVQDGTAGSGPVQTVELVTGDTGLDSACDAAAIGPLFCGDVTIRSFYTYGFSQVFAQVLTLSPATGFGVENGDEVPGASSGLGSWSYGELGAGSAAPANAGARNWVFSRSGGNFTFTGRVVASIVEACDGLDNDCDGLTDEGLGCRTSGQSCFGVADCVAGLACVDDLCALVGCPSGQHLASGTCIGDDRSCAAPNGTGSQRWLGEAWDVCVATGCDAGYHLEGGACLSDQRACIVTGGVGSQVWRAGGWEACSPSTCSAGYQLSLGSCIPAGCGNGLVEVGEACDDGNLIASDGCTAACAVAVCGDGLIRTGVEGCDDGNLLTDVCNYGATSCTVCSATCAVVAGETDFCGDGLLDAAELCDDGNGVDGDGCTSACLCGSGYHVAGSLCVSDFRSCTLPNALAAAETWTGSGFGACTASACEPLYHSEAGLCVSNSRACTLANATVAVQRWDGVGYAVCEATACSSGFTLLAGVCTTASCGNGALEAGETCDDGNQVASDGCTATCAVAACGDGIVRAAVEGCDDGNLLTEACTYGTVSCTVCSASCTSLAGAVSFCGDGLLAPVEVCDDGNLTEGDGCSGSCVCGSNFHLEGGICTNDTQPCALPNGSGLERWNGTGYGGTCNVTACDAGYHISGNSCAANRLSCLLPNALVAEQEWSTATSSYSACVAVSCASTYHLEGGGCATDSRICSVSNGSGIETWNGSGYGLCLPVGCNSGFHAEGGGCEPNTRACASLPVGATAATQSWDSATGSYGACTATACTPAFHAESGSCLSDVRACLPLPANTTSGTQAWSSSSLTWGACSALSCATNFSLSGGQCRPGIVEVGTPNDQYSCALRADGTLQCAGSAYFLGTGSTTDSATPVVVTGITTALHASNGSVNGGPCVALANGSVKCWGGSSASYSSPVGITGITQAVYASGSRTMGCALLRDGTVSCWGSNTYGQLGRTGGDSVTPITVAGVAGATQISVGERAVCALMLDGTVKCWGRVNDLGIGLNTGSLSVAVTVPGVAGATQVSAGVQRQCARIADGHVKCWGNNGPLGTGSGGQSYSAIEVMGVTDAVSVSAGSFICILSSNGTVSCMSTNSVYGELGNGSTAPSYLPTPVSGITNATQIAVGYESACARLADGTAKCWGRNATYGQLGVGGKAYSTTPVTVLGIETAVQIATSTHAACARLADGRVMCWGYASNGATGSGFTCDSSGGDPTTSPTGINTPLAVAGITTAIDVSMAIYHGCAVLADGSVRCWGNGANNQLATGVQPYFNTYCSPAAEVTIPPASQVSTGNLYSCALLRDGTISCWGTGQLGNGASSTAVPPVTVTGITTATQISSFGSNTCALLADGTVRCWGAGQLGNGTSGASSLPVQVTGISTATQVSVGGGHSCARLASGAVQCWGGNGYKQLGDGTTTGRTTPVTVVGISNATSVAAGQRETCVSLADGGAKCWGNNLEGQLGNGTTLSAAAPSTVVGLSSVAAVQTGGYSNCALLSTGSVSCWGLNDNGELGDDSGFAPRLTPRAVVIAP
jgi:cysteine-rich repeat protein